MFASYVQRSNLLIRAIFWQVKLIQVTRFPLKEVEALYSYVFCIFIICTRVYTPHQH